MFLVYIEYVVVAWIMWDVGRDIYEGIVTHRAVERSIQHEYPDLDPESFDGV